MNSTKTIRLFALDFYEVIGYSYTDKTLKTIFKLTCISIHNLL